MDEYDSLWCRPGAPAGPKHPEIPHPEQPEEPQPVEIPADMRAPAHVAPVEPIPKIQHHLGIPPTPEHPIPILSKPTEPSQAPLLVEQTMPSEEPTKGEAQASEPSSPHHPPATI
ncbi:hypothetical protein CK203_064867 [Vitis vinifera]|uniref:Uncharacterized protein n=1 Tax=Vitis vinifera TaxID=29760 RepID=A0A438FP77_VITVI|nr:hypothetical protein CK203_064867 [Vitis vinifera]